MTGEAFFRSLTRHLADAFGAEVAFVAELLGEPPQSARVLAVSHNGADLHEGFEFRIEGTPCSLVVEHDFVSLPEGTVARFPDDDFTVRHGLDSYLAVAAGRIVRVGLRDERGQTSMLTALPAPSLIPPRAPGAAPRDPATAASTSWRARTAASAPARAPSARSSRRRRPPWPSRSPAA